MSCAVGDSWEMSLETTLKAERVLRIVFDLKLSLEVRYHNSNVRVSPVSASLLPHANVFALYSMVLSFTVIRCTYVLSGFQQVPSYIGKRYG
jgi:hypothetical protein